MLTNFRPPHEFRSETILPLPDGTERTFTSRSRTVVEQSRPPGPKWLRDCLGKNAFAEVVGVHFSFLDGPPGELDPQVLNAFPHLEIAMLKESQINDAWIAQCAKSNTLRELVLLAEIPAELSPAGVASLQRAKQLQLLMIYGNGIPNEALMEVSKLRQLQALILNNNDQLDSKILAPVSELSGLQLLWLNFNERLDDEGTQRLSRLKNLRSLSLRCPQIGDGALEAIAELEHLELLDLEGTRITTEGVKRIGWLRNLRELRLSQTAIGNEALQSLGSLFQLKFLHLDGTQVTEECLATIAGFTELELLSIGFATPPAAENLQHLRSLEKLQAVMLRVPDLTPQAAKELSDALPQVRLRLFDADRLILDRKALEK
ncbi:leucine-rich repeat domain-containing protein [Anatilimnocola floriformis]|uniref:leucine-rich repeat domain-containing protein n=1 Tax=Anatilimnocola floriformis TaxID=2948575 RepID=UPI0020C385DF|nr:hypothetical protein [Anatilimnocola floriformis]